MSGYAVLLVEQNDIACGTTAASTRLIHGGLRYLEYGEIRLVRESLAERERLLRAAPHLVQPLRLHIPFYRGRGRPGWKIRVGLQFYDWLSWDRSLPGHERMNRDTLLNRLPTLDSVGLVGGAAYYDAQVSYPERLVVELVLDAAQSGADVHTRSRVTGLQVDDRHVTGVSIEGESGTWLARADTVVNAAGPWVDQVFSGSGFSRLIGGTQGAHLIMAPFPGAPAEAVYVQAQSDGRPFFVIPWNGLYLVGTTDFRFEGDPATARSSAEEHQYLLEETQRISATDQALLPYVCYAQAGVRPLPYTPGGATGAITRSHVIHRHEQVQGLYSIVGGKLTTHRALAEDFATTWLRRRGGPRAADTRERMFPGGMDAADQHELVADLERQFGPSQAARLWRVYGGRAGLISRLCAEAPETALVTGPESRVLIAELVHALDTEFAVGLVDLIFRRTMVGLDADQGAAAVQGAAQALVRLGIWNRSRGADELEACAAFMRRGRVR